MSDPSKPEEPMDPEDKAASALQDEIGAFVEGAAGLFDSLKDIFLRSREEVVRGARLGKVRLEVYQQRKDREQKLQRLGALAYELLVSDAISHPDLVDVFEELAELDEKIAVGEAEISELAPAEEESEGVELTVVEDAPEPAPAPVEAVIEEPAPDVKEAPKPKPKKRATRAASGAKKKPARPAKKTEEN